MTQLSFTSDYGKVVDITIKNEEIISIAIQGKKVRMTSLRAAIVARYFAAQIADELGTSFVYCLNKIF